MSLPLNGIDCTRRSLICAIGAGLAAPFLPTGARAAEPVVVEIASGKLRGMRAEGGCSFRGVPYAADTGGRNRFMAPRPVRSWSGIREAVAYGDRCVQGRGSPPAGTTAKYSENCCVLNVYTPDVDPSALRPVMLHMHGGGFRSGAGDAPAVEGTNLARLGDMVVITVNHRLNVFGYLPLGHLDPDFADAGNAGQLDLIAALAWVKDNIRAFGGDPNRVMITGQSGGGSKVTALMVMPGAKGLFHRAVNMSGSSGYALLPATDAEPLISDFINRLGVSKSNLRKLQEFPPQQLLAAHAASVAALRTDDFRPVLDGRHIFHAPRSPQGLALNADVPMMIGAMETEAYGRMHSAVTEAELKAKIMGQWSLDDARAEAVIAGYRQDPQNRTAEDILIQLASDTRFRNRTLGGAQDRAALERAPVYVYNFTWKVPATGRTPHGTDIPFAFHNVDKVRGMTGPGPGPERAALALASAFAAMARTGNPSNPNMPMWPPYDLADRPTMTVNETCQVINDYRGNGRRMAMALPNQETLQLERGPVFERRGTASGD